MSKMFLSVPLVLLILTGVSECHFQQKLKCPYTAEQKRQPRIWCKRDDANHECCSGFAFQAGDSQLLGGSLTVQDDGQAFVVSVNSLSQGDGVYWCGLKNSSNVIVKLAESQLYSRKTRSEKKRNAVYESVLEEKQR
ncbi:uncharacterized protein si:ch211-102c2.4 isoform X2 [Colossoma macropomum]|uniref:uncharacterized protein si:ch211-102c2.4 isoform X2 n=1 Tax=Colossoma macropomum TaxID=42526 RepID=UPI0018649937|nr:uncharacterized protein si:ch211-102c2.4 isoform X2 [Colossoma macropomum]